MNSFKNDIQQPNNIQLLSTSPLFKYKAFQWPEYPWIHTVPKPKALKNHLDENLYLLVVIWSTYKYLS